MFILSVLSSYLLIFILPGLIFCRYLNRYKLVGENRRVLIPAVSMSVVIIYVYISTFVSTVNYYATWILFGCLLLVYLLHELISLKRTDVVRQGYSIEWSIADLLHLTLLCIALMIFAIFSYENAFKIMNVWDGIFGWNKFTLSILDGTFLKRAGHYPQGLPSLGAIVYLMSGDLEQTIWVRHVTNLFPILAILALSTVYRSNSILPFVYSILLLYIVHNNFDKIQEGYLYSYTADFFVILSVLLVISVVKNAFLDDVFQPNTILSELDWKTITVYGFTLGLVSALAANVKQSGVFTLVFTTICAFALPGGSIKQKFLFALKIGLFCAAIGCIWYFFVAFRVLNDSTTTNTSFLISGVHQGKNNVERAFAAIEGMKTLTGGSVLYVLFFTSLLTLFSRFGRLVWCFLLIPNAILYLFVSGYALRNSAPVIAVLLFLSAFGIDITIRLFERRLRCLKVFFYWLYKKRYYLHNITLIAKTGFVLLTVGVVIFLATRSEDFRSLAEKQEIEQSSELGWKSVNKILEISMCEQSPGEVLYTNYSLAERLPSLRKFRVEVGGYSIDKIDRMVNEEAEFSLFVLWYDRSSKEFQDYLENLERQGVMDIVHHRSDGVKWKFLRRKEK